MSSDDIANLYRQFGGTPDNYQELGRDNVVRQSRERWPLLANVRQQDAARAAVKPVSAGERPGSVDAGAPLAPVFDEAAAAAAAEAARNRPPAAPRTHASHADAAATAGPAAEIARPAPTGPIEPAFVAEPQAPVDSRALPPFARPPSAATSFTPVTPAAASRGAEPAGTELQGLFARLARPPEPPVPAADRETSLLRRLLRS